MDYKRYRRYFIILDREDSGFDNKPGKSPKGYTKIEIKNGKGVLSHFVQNLKYDEKAPYIYRGYLVGIAGNHPIYADTGSIVIDQQGKGELTWRFDPENVDGKGNSIDAFKIIAIVGEKLGTSSETVTAPLVGYVDKKKAPWKNAFIEIASSQKQEVREVDSEPVKEEFQAAVQEESILPEKSEETMEKAAVLEADTAEIPEVEESKALREEMILEEVEAAKIEVNLQEPEKTEESEEKNMIEDEIPVEILAAKENAALKGEVVEESVDKVEAVNIEKENIRVLEDKTPTESIFEKPIEEMKDRSVDVEEMKTIEEGEEAAKDQIPEEDPKGETPPIPPRQKGIFNQYQNLESEQMKYYRGKSSQQYNQQNFKMAVNYVKNVLKHYEKAEPFENNLEGYQWWKIESSPQTMQRGFPPFYGYISNMYTYYPYMNYMTGYPDLIYKYQHYIFGLKADENDEPTYFVYGVPGKFALSEQPYEGMTGFVYWHSMQDKEPNLGDYGYWILHIDAKTGSVAMPLKATPPPGY
ncbi:hypothetical protein [Geosporobacter ferrireducens]|uniref:Uncharacterized protein n=1 Tax=Geosporobacter ferrireducens TaxID=1424294 RepID=A0A1D8GH98_9FIRM|nr:hypothetical protein [Geosporobacter ferrireducens]AOT70271.1 hypothetical protein Gferi_12095 [Geosporobacter ferrireducens]